MNNLRISTETTTIENPVYGITTETKFHVCKDFESNSINYSSKLLQRGDIVETFTDKGHAQIFLNAMKVKIKEVITSFDNKEVTPQQWHTIRHYDQTKKCSMLGAFNGNNKIKYNVIFKDKTDMTVYV
jgi:hypothetical protein